VSRPGAAAAWLKRSLLVLGLLAALAAAALWAKAEHIVLGAEGFMFGYPLVIMELTRAGSEASVGPPNHLKRVRAFPDAGFKEVVRPNVDTLYTSAFIDMAQGPFVFEMPAQSQRYELMPFMDGWTNVFAAPGTRTLGDQGGRFLLAGPGWAGTVPEGLSLLRAPTRMVWLIGRTQTHGAADYAVVHKLQDGIRLRTLAHWTAGIDPPAPAWQPAAERAPPPGRQMQGMTTTAFFDRLALLMADNPPAPADAPMLAKLARIGVAPGQPPDWGPLERTAVGLGRWIAERRVRRELAQPRDLINGWSTPPSLLGDYGTHYNIRAVVAMVGLGANLPADATYPNTRIDAAGQPLNGSHRYRLHFAAGQLPPVRAFWSLTAYGADDLLIANPLNRHALGDRDPLVFNADGSLDLWVQAEPPPAEHRANWLPVKAGEPFVLNARLYWPKAEALDGRWHMPPVQRVD
jgi:hypothetical protein